MLVTTSGLALPSQIDFRSKKFLNFKIYLSLSLNTSGFKRRDQRRPLRVPRSNEQPGWGTFKPLKFLSFSLPRSWWINNSQIPDFSSAAFALWAFRLYLSTSFSGLGPETTGVWLGLTKKSDSFRGQTGFNLEIPRVPESDWIRLENWAESGVKVGPT